MACRTTRIDPENPDPGIIEEARSVLEAGELVAFPTETFYGLGADASNKRAVERVFNTKKRARTKPLLVIIRRKEQLADLVTEIPESALKLIDTFWPGPLTIIFKARKDLPALLTCGTETVGIRISSHPVAQALSLAFGRPLTATSANISGGKSPSTAQDIYEQMGNEIEMILDGGRTIGTTGSTIIDVSVSPPRLIRDGAVPLSDIKRTLTLDG